MCRALPESRLVLVKNLLGKDPAVGLCHWVLSFRILTPAVTKRASK